MYISGGCPDLITLSALLCRPLLMWVSFFWFIPIFTCLSVTCQSQWNSMIPVSHFSPSAAELDISSPPLSCLFEDDPNVLWHCWTMAQWRQGTPKKLSHIIIITANQQCVLRNNILRAETLRESLLQCWTVAAFKIVAKINQKELFFVSFASKYQVGWSAKHASSPAAACCECP